MARCADAGLAISTLKTTVYCAPWSFATRACFGTSATCWRTCACTCVAVPPLPAAERLLRCGDVSGCVRQRRLERIEDIRHDHGAVLPADTLEKLSSKEVDYFKQYDSLLTGYMRAVHLDLTAVGRAPCLPASLPPCRLSSPSPHSRTPVSSTWRLLRSRPCGTGYATTEAPPCRGASARRLRRHHDVVRPCDSEEGRVPAAASN
jgi:hypothetical protein